jgi:peptidylprolyl isomerase
VSTTLRRSSVAALSLLLLVGVSACGDDMPATASGSSASRLDAVTITGDVGTVPDVTWKDRMTATTAENKVLVTGDGPTLEDGASVLAQYWIGNGFTEEKAVSSYDEGKAQLFTLDDQLSPVFLKALTGATIGSRVAVTASATEAFGETGNAGIGIANKDTVLIIVDVLSSLATEPSGTEAAAPSWMPAITSADAEPTAFDFAGIPQPAGKFRKATLLAGAGERVRKGMTVAVDYLGQVYRADKPFDQSYTTQPATFAIGVGQVISGWDKQVVGSTVGSRIVIEVPPKLGYGTAGNTDAGIKGTDTLYFVIDILAAG